MDIESAIRERYQNLEWALDERLRRLYAATEAKVLGHGGISLVQKATGVVSTIALMEPPAEADFGSRSV